MREQVQELDTEETHNVTVAKQEKTLSSQYEKAHIHLNR